MADISVIKMPNNTSYNLKDAAARTAIAALPTDVRIDGVSIVEEGIANIPRAGASRLGVIKASTNYGLYITTSNDPGMLRVQPAYENDVKEGTHGYRPIVPSTQHSSVFYGLTKAAGINMASSNNAIGTYTDEAKAAIQKMLGVSQLLAPVEDTLTASQAYAINKVFAYNGKLYKATIAIASGDTITPGTNCTEVNVASTFVKTTDLATATTPGIVFTEAAAGLGLTSAGKMYVAAAAESVIKNGTADTKPICVNGQHFAAFYGLAKAAGADEKDSALAFGTYSTTAQTAIKAMLGVNVDDVQIEGVSIVQNGVANIPKAGSATFGTVKLNVSYGIYRNANDQLYIAMPSDADIKEGLHNYRPISPAKQHKSVFYGLAKAAGDTTQTISDNAIGTYTDEAKAAIQSMLGINSMLAPSEADLTADQAYAINDIFAYNGKLYKATAAISTSGTITPGTNCEETTINSTFVKNTDIASTSNLGIVGISNDSWGIKISSTSHKLYIERAYRSDFRIGTNAYRPVVSVNLADAVWVGLAKAAGASITQSDSNTTWTYTDTQTSAIRNMLGAVGTTDYATTENYGLVKIGARLEINSSTGKLAVPHATIDQIKSRSNERVLTPMNQHYATFYGLGRVAGISSNYSVGDVDTTTEIGTYSDAAKAAIQSMLGVNSMLAPVESDLTADQAYAINDIFSYNGKLYKATSAITLGDTITPSTNCAETKASEVFVKNTDYATSTKAGVIKSGDGTYGIRIANGGEFLVINAASTSEIKSGTTNYKPLIAMRQHISTFYGLAKAAGDTTQASSDNAVGTYTNTAKAAIQTMLGVPSSADLNYKVDKSAIEDAGITGYTYSTLFGGEFSVTTVASNDYISPYARASVTGRISKHYIHRVTFNGTEYILPTRIWFVSNIEGLKVYEYLGNLNLFISDVSGVPDGTDNVPFVIISDLNDSSSIDVLTQTAGTYTIKIERITPAKKDLPKSIIYGDNYAPIEKKNNGGTYNGFSIGLNELKNTRATFAVGYGNQIAHEFSTLIGSENVTNTIHGYAFGSDNSVGEGFAIGKGNDVTNFGYAFGTVNDVDYGYAIGHSLISTNNILALGQNNIEDNAGVPEWVENTAYTVGQIVNKSPYPSSWQCAEDHISSSDFLSDLRAGKWSVSLVKSDTVLLVGNGIDENNRSNALRINLAGDTHIKGDVYANCNADSTGGTKLVSQTDYATATNPGVVCVDPNLSPLTMWTNPGTGKQLLMLNAGNSADIKAGESLTKPIMVMRQHESTFYGLAKAAGDSTQSQSNNAVGTYTAEAKAAIQNMLGVESGVCYIENISGTTPTIIGEANTRYICGEVTSISITPPANGIIDVLFTSGSTPAILTIPSTVKMPGWFSTTLLETNTRYEINIMDGVYGTVMLWS